MTTTKAITPKAERQTATQLYQNLSANDRILFRSILEMTMVLLKNIQQ